MFSVFQRFFIETFKRLLFFLYVSASLNLVKSPSSTPTPVWQYSNIEKKKFSDEIHQFHLNSRFKKFIEQTTATRCKKMSKNSKMCTVIHTAFVDNSLNKASRCCCCCQSGGCSLFAVKLRRAARFAKWLELFLQC